MTDLYKRTSYFYTEQCERDTYCFRASKLDAAEHRHRRTTDAYDAAKGRAFGDYIMVPELADLLEKLRETRPELVFKPTPEYHPGGYAYKVAVLMPDQLFMLGVISYGEIVASGVPAYAVYSRKISNTKYTMNSEGRNRTTSLDDSRTLKMIDRYIVPYTPQEVADKTVYLVSTAMRDSIQEPGIRLRRFIEECFNANISLGDVREYAKEILAMKQAGYSGFGPRTTKAISGIENLYDDAERSVGRRPGTCLVRVDAVGSRPAFTIASHNAGWIHTLNNNQDEIGFVGLMRDPTAWYVCSHSEATLPMWILEKLAALSTLEEQDYVAEVGMRLGSNDFWIEVNG